MLSKDLQDLITDNRVGLVGSINLTEILWAELIAKRVVTDEDKQILTVCTLNQKLTM